jgi:acetyltransferase-like isoleucine patch superfamily enzyme
MRPVMMQNSLIRNCPDMAEESNKESIQKQLSHCPTGMLDKYRSTMVGNRGNCALLFHEVIGFFFMPIQSSFGAWLRKRMVRLLVGQLGQSVRIGANCAIRNGKQIFIGDHVSIGDEVTLAVRPGKNKLILGDHLTIGSRVIFNCAGGEINVGEGTTIESYCRLGSLQGLTIGYNCRIGKEGCVVGAGHTADDLEKPIIDQPVNCSGPNFIGDFVSIGERVTILDGVRIGSHVKIHADSMVNRDIPDGCTVTGVPARIINKISVTEEELAK